MPAHFIDLAQMTVLQGGEVRLVMGNQGGADDAHRAGFVIVLPQQIALEIAAMIQKGVGQWSQRVSAAAALQEKEQLDNGEAIFRQ